MGWIRVILVKLIALAILAGGLLGMKANEFKRMYFQNASYRIAGATPDIIDAIFKEASEVNFRDEDYVVTRKQSNTANTLEVIIQADSLSERSGYEYAFRMKLEQAVRARKLVINSTSTSSGSRTPEIFQTRRMDFIFFSAISALGMAMLLLSFRVFGGGRREEAPDLGTLKTTES